MLGVVIKRVGIWNVICRSKMFQRVVFSTNSKVKSLKEAIAEKVPSAQEEIKEFRQKHGKKKIGDINVDMIYNGMRDMTALLCETSNLCPENGILYRGRTIEECQSCLPRAFKDGQPLPESAFWLLCTGDIPSAEEISNLASEWTARAKLPKHVVDMLKNMPKYLHPMTQLSCAVCALNHESRFAREYSKGVEKAKHWELVYEDASDLIAKLPLVCAIIYNNVYKGRKDEVDQKDQTDQKDKKDQKEKKEQKVQKEQRELKEPDFNKIVVSPSLDWTGNFMKMMGFEDQAFVELMRLYMVLHCDYEGGNVSAHAVNLVGSALADPFLSYAAGVNGVAGPLHGLKNQEVLNWMKKMQAEIGIYADDAKIKEYVLKLYKAGKMMPGYANDERNKTDPRFKALFEYAQKHKPNEYLVKVVGKLNKIVPEILKADGKTRNIEPTVDLASGASLSAFGMTQLKFYAVLFAMSRSLGTMAQLIWSRALALPIEYPKSYPTKALMEMVHTDGDGGNERGDDSNKKGFKAKDVNEAECKAKEEEQKSKAKARN